MLYYCTHLRVNEELTRDILIDMYIDWIMNSANKMDGLEYDGSQCFEYSVDSKKLRIEDFEDYGILGLQFITSDNNRNMTFIVEVMFDYINEYLDLNFYNEIKDDSVYHGIKGIPNIFKMLLTSDYILDDNNIKIDNKPHYMSRNEYDDMLSKIYNLPIVVLNRDIKGNKLCVVNPNKLAEKLYGIAHVVVINRANDPQLEILYPNTYKEKISKDKEIKMIALCFEGVNEYLKRVNSEYFNYDDLLNMRLDYVQSVNEKNSKATFDMFRDEVEELEERLEFLRNEFKTLNDEMISLSEKEILLNKKLEESSREAILYTSKTGYEDDRKVLIDLLNKIYGNFHPKKPFRKIPVLKSIIEGQE